MQRVTIIIPADLQPQVVALATMVEPVGATMFQTPLSPTGQLPATHYIAAGLLDDQYITMLTDPDALAVATGVTVEEASALQSACIVSWDDPDVVKDSLGVQLVNEFPEPEVVPVTEEVTQ